MRAGGKGEVLLETLCSTEIFFHLKREVKPLPWLHCSAVNSVTWISEKDGGKVTKWKQLDCQHVEPTV